MCHVTQHKREAGAHAAPPTVPLHLLKSVASPGMEHWGTCSTPNSAMITLTQISGVASYEALGHMQHPQQCH